MNENKSQYVYVAVMKGLRGCYLPDDSHIYAFKNFREFAATIRYEREFGEFRRRGNLRETWKALQSPNASYVYGEDLVGVSGEFGDYGLMVAATDQNEYRALCEYLGNDPEDE